MKLYGWKLIMFPSGMSRSRLSGRGGNPAFHLQAAHLLELAFPG
jgi:hypothetical protein